MNPFNLPKHWWKFEDHPQAQNLWDRYIADIPFLYYFNVMSRPDRSYTYYIYLDCSILLLLYIVGVCVATYIVAPRHIVAGNDLCRYSRHILSPLRLYCRRQQYMPISILFSKLMGRHYILLTLILIIAGNRICRQLWNKLSLKTADLENCQC